MKDKFVLKQATEVSSVISMKNSFIRYDLSEEWRLYDDFLNKFKNKNGRYPFVYDILKIYLAPLSSSLQKKVNNILNNKSYQWFFDIGQYFFYNLYQWIKNFKNIKLTKKNRLGNNLSNQKFKTNEFLEAWWSSFCKFENKNSQNNFKDPLISHCPEKILLELTNNCNLNCIMCGVGKNGYNPLKNFSLDLLRNLCEGILSKVKLIRLNGLGESTIIPNFLEYLELICNLSARLEIVTNLTVQNQKIWDKLIENQTNFLISCDSANAQKYEAIRKRAKFSSFVRNLKRIGNNISNPLQAQIIFTLMEQNTNDLLGVIEMAANFGLGGVIVNVVKSDSTSNYWMERDFDKIQKIFKKAYLYAKERGFNLKLPDHIGNNLIDSKISTLSSNIYCENPWKEVYIRYNGDLTVCNMLNPYIYGNCRNYPFEKIWNGLNANMFRFFVNTKFRHSYCRDCYYLV